MTPPCASRRTPCTARGIARVPCSRCGAPSVPQRQACANGRRDVGRCLACDIALNRMALMFMRLPNADALMVADEARVRGE